MSTENPISPKAIAATTGAGLGAAFGTLITWLLGVTVWGASAEADRVADAMAAVPSPITALIVLLIPAGLAAVLGWHAVDPNRVTTHELRTLRNTQADAQADGGV